MNMVMHEKKQPCKGICFYDVLIWALKGLSSPLRSAAWKPIFLGSSGPRLQV